MKFSFLLLIICLCISCAKDEIQVTIHEEQDSTPVSDLFTVTADPIFESPLGIAGDPSILKDGDVLRMYYSAENFKIATVNSIDNGLTWNSPDGNTEDDYASLTGQADNWDSTLETNEVLKVEDTFYMYYSGYREDNIDNDYVANYEIGLATSEDGINFTRHPNSMNEPLLGRDLTDMNTNDRHAMTSPGVQFVNGQFYMTYTGWNVTDNWTGPNAGFKLLGATSVDGINWTKLDEPILTPEDIEWSPDINETTLIYSEEDGFWYIVFSTDVNIGLARSSNFEGPYDVNPQAIVIPNLDWASEVTAPDGFIENGKFRIWYHGVAAPLYFPWLVGYAEADYPLEW